jgi:hypothetical protein
LNTFHNLLSWVLKDCAKMVPVEYFATNEAK